MAVEVYVLFVWLIVLIVVLWWGFADYLTETECRML